MSVAKSTLSDDVRHRTLPPWGLYFFNSPRHFPIDAHFHECVNHDDAMPWMVTCGAFDSTQKESTTPKGVASASHLSPRVASYRRQPRAIKSTTPMGLPYHCPFMTTTTTGTRIILRWSCTHHCPFITTTTMGTRITLRWDCVPHEHSSPRHGIGMVSDTSIYYNSITWSVTIPQRRIECRIAIHCQDIA